MKKYIVLLLSTAVVLTMFTGCRRQSEENPGDPTVNKDFNLNSFVDCYQYPTIDDAVERIIEIDKNDDLYIHMLCEYRYKVADYENVMFKKLEEYLYHIFDQDVEEAYRRPRFYRSVWHETYLKEYNKYMLSVPHRILKKFGI